MKSIAIILLLGSVGWGQTISHSEALKIAEVTSSNGVGILTINAHGQIIAINGRPIVSGGAFPAILPLAHVTISRDIRYCDDVSGKDAECVMRKGQSFISCKMGEHFESDYSKPGIASFGCIKNKK